MIRSHVIPATFAELRTAALLFFLDDLDLPKRRNAFRARLTAALDLPRGTIAAWPVEACDLAIKARLSLDDKPGGLDKAAIVAACDAVWPEFMTSTAARAHDWRDRADCGTR